MSDNERLRWPPSSAFNEVLNDCFYEAENTGIYPWQAIWYLLSVLLPDTAARIRPHISYNSTITIILQHKMGSEPLEIDMKSLPILLQCISGQFFFHALEAYKGTHLTALTDLFVEARLGIIALIWSQTDENALFLLYETIDQLLNMHRNLTLDKICKLLFIPEVAVDTTVFAHFLLEIGEILSPNMYIIKTNEQLIKIALLRSIFSFTLLLYAAAPPPCLKTVIFSDLFLATCLPYQFISPVHFTLAICNILINHNTLSLSMRITIGELVLESLTFELTNTSSLISLSNLIENGFCNSKISCCELLESTKALLTSEAPNIDTSLEQSIALLAVSAFPCLPDYTMSITHLSVPFVELSILMKDFNSKSETSTAQLNPIFAVSIPTELTGETIEMLRKHFFVLSSKNMWIQVTLLAMCFQIIAGRLRLESYNESGTSNFPRLDISTLIEFLGNLFVDESDTVVSALVNLNSPTFLNSFHTPNNQQEIGNLYYLTLSPRLGRINSIKLWNLFSFYNSNLPNTRQFRLFNNQIFGNQGTTATALLKSVLASTSNNNEESLQWCSKWIAYLLEITTINANKITDSSLSSLEIPIYLLFSFTLSLQYLSHASAISKVQSDTTVDNSSEDTITNNSFIDYISNTWTLATNPSISTILLFDAYSCDFHDDSLPAVSTLSVLYTVYPVFTQEDLQFYLKSGLSFLGTGKSVIEFYKRGTISPLLVTFIVLYVISPEAFLPIHVLVSYLMAFSLCPTYETALPLLCSISPGRLGTCLMNQENQILSLFYDLHTRNSSGNRTVISNTKQRLWRLLDRHLITIHFMTLYVSLLICISMYELSLLNYHHFLENNSKNENVSMGVLRENVKSLLLRHLVSISIVYFTSAITCKRISITMDEYVTKSPAIFLEINNAFSERLNCSTITMSNLIRSLQYTWAHSPFIKATIDISSFFVSLIYSDIVQYFKTETDAPSCFLFNYSTKTIISAIEAVVSLGACLSTGTDTDNFTDLFLIVLFMAYNSQSISKLLTDAWINNKLKDKNANSDYTLLQPFVAHLYQIQIEQFVVQLFAHIPHRCVLPPINLSEQQGLESSNRQTEPSIKRQEPSTQASEALYTTNRYLLYIQLADVVASLCTRAAKLYAHKHIWLQSTEVCNIATNILIDTAHTLASVDKIITDLYLRQELHACPVQLQNLLCYTQSHLDNSNEIIAQMKLFCSTELTNNLFALDALLQNNISYIKVYCNAWRLLICSGWLASSTTRGTDYNHIPALMICYHGGLTIYTYCLLRGLFLTKTRKTKLTLQTALRLYLQKCTSIKHYLSLLPVYIPGWQPTFTNTLPILLTAFSTVLGSSIVTLNPAEISSILINFSGVIQQPNMNLFEALTAVLVTEEDVTRPTPDCQ